MKTEEAIRTYPFLKSNMLGIQGLLSAIPGSWKCTLRQSNLRKLTADELQDITLVIDNKPIKIENVNSRLLYDVLTEPQIPAAVARWAHYSVRPKKWKNIYEIPFKCTTSTKLQSLHYRVINRFIPTRRYLCVRGVVGSPLRLKCFETDDLQHFFLAVGMLNRSGSMSSTY